jgi:drug/metabolite transporter (DMT)-like permease
VEHCAFCGYGSVAGKFGAALVMRKPTGQPSGSSTRWQRILLLAIATIMMLAGLVVSLQSNLDAGSAQFLSGTLWKVAVVVILAWLAAPQLERLGWQRVRGTMLAAIVIVLLLYAIRPKLGAIAAALLIASSVLLAIVGWLRRLAKP